MQAEKDRSQDSEYEKEGRNGPWGVAGVRMGTGGRSDGPTVYGVRDSSRNVQMSCVIRLDTGRGKRQPREEEEGGHGGNDFAKGKRTGQVSLISEGDYRLRGLGTNDSTTQSPVLRIRIFSG